MESVKKPIARPEHISEDSEEYKLNREIVQEKIPYGSQAFAESELDYIDALRKGLSISEQRLEISKQLKMDLSQIQEIENYLITTKEKIKEQFQEIGKDILRKSEDDILKVTQFLDEAKDLSVVRAYLNSLEEKYEYIKEKKYNDSIILLNFIKKTKFQMKFWKKF